MHYILSACIRRQRQRSPRQWVLRPAFGGWTTFDMIEAFEAVQVQNALMRLAARVAILTLYTLIRRLDGNHLSSVRAEYMSLGREFRAICLPAHLRMSKCASSSAMRRMIE